MSDPTIAVLGEAVIDMVATSAGTFEAWPGGGPVNISVGLARFGHHTQLLARLSKTPLGDLLSEHLASAGVQLDYSVQVAEPPTLAVATLDPVGRAQYQFYAEGTADWGWTDDELAVVWPEVFHTGSLALFLAPNAILGLLNRLAASETMVSLDPNVRADLLTDRDHALEVFETALTTANVVKASDEDITWLYPRLSADEVLGHWISAGVELGVITLGAKGCVALHANGLSLRLPARPALVVDTIGAGDAFMSGLLSGLIDLGYATRTAIAELDSADLQRVLRRAGNVAAATCSQRGANPPTRTEYQRFALAR